MPRSMIMDLKGSAVANIHGCLEHACSCALVFPTLPVSCLERPDLVFGMPHSPIPMLDGPLCPRLPGFSSPLRPLIYHWPFPGQVAAGLPRHWTRAGRSALAMIPLAPAILLLNQFGGLRRRLWPKIRRRLKISYAPLEQTMTNWHQYTLSWMPDGCTFLLMTNRCWRRILVQLDRLVSSVGWITNI